MELNQFKTGVSIKVTTLGTDAFLSVMRLGLMLSVTRIDVSNHSFENHEEFTFFKPFDANDKQVLVTGLEPWIEASKTSALERFYRRLVTVDVPSSAQAAVVETPAEIPAPKKTRAKRETTTPVVEPQTEEPAQTKATEVAANEAKEPQAPATEVKEEPKAAEPSTQQAEVVSVPAAQPETFVKYDKSNKDHARLVQTWLDVLTPDWKRDAKQIAWIKDNLVPALHGKADLFVDGKENVLLKAKIGTAVSKKDVAFLN